MTSVPTRPRQQATGQPQSLTEKVLLRLIAVVLVLAGLAAMCMTAAGQRL